MIDRLLAAAAPWTIAGTLLIVALPLPLRLGSYAYLPVLLAIAAIGAAMIAAEPRASRPMLWRIVALALFCRLAVLVALAWAQLRFEGALVVGPDGAVFFENSGRLAARAASLSPPNFLEWGTYDIGHYYVFAALIRDFGADLFALQVFNCGLMALSAGLMFSAVNLIESRYAPAVGVLAALYPASVALAGYDLWKDPSVAFATAAFLWAALRASHAERSSSIAGFSGVAAAALAYLRCTRFYVAAYIEVGIVAVAAITAIRRSSMWRRRVAVACLASAIVFAEGVPWLMGWPISPVLLFRQVQYTLTSPRLLRSGSSRFFQGGRLPSSGRDPHFAPAGGRLVYVPPPDESADDLQPGGPIVHVTNAFRRVYGPFIWILPSAVSGRLLFRSDYLLYPGMAVWYASVPFILAGLAIVCWRTAKGRETNIALIAVAAFVVTYFSQYFSMNLSYRQRDIMFPFLMIFACVGWTEAWRFSRWRLAYGGYWVLLCSIAVVHLIVRSALHR